MAKIKHTKNELKAQKEALHRYERFLPMLLLKKQQLQHEVNTLRGQVAAKREEDIAVRDGLRAWVKLLSEPVDLDEFVGLQDVQTEEGNIAGVVIPLLVDVTLRTAEPDLFTSPPWIDEAMDTLGALIRLRVEREILEERERLLAEELRVTSQRVNLFEKVKIPECGENIRVIKIFLGDEQTAAVARGKIAKKRSDNT